MSSLQHRATYSFVGRNISSFVANMPADIRIALATELNKHAEEAHESSRSTPSECIRKYDEDGTCRHEICKGCGYFYYYCWSQTYSGNVAQYVDRDVYECIICNDLPHCTYCHENVSIRTRDGLICGPCVAEHALVIPTCPFPNPCDGCHYVPETDKLLCNHLTYRSPEFLKRYDEMMSKWLNLYNS